MIEYNSENFKKETQKSICMWSKETFGLSDDLHRTYLHFRKELQELECEIYKEFTSIEVDYSNLESELADVQILLYQIAEFFAIDLEEATRSKMQINRKRTWVHDENGLGVHV